MGCGYVDDIGWWYKSLFTQCLHKIHAIVTHD